MKPVGANPAYWPWNSDAVTADALAITTPQYTPGTNRAVFAI
jgi:hypothetical protein